MSSSNFRCVSHIIPGQHIRHYPHSTSDNEEAVIRFSVKQYTPLDNANPLPGDVTIISGHASGQPREMYEPMWDALLECSRRSKGFRIRNIWVYDAYNQNSSHSLNEGLLGDEPSWFDIARDVLAMANHFRAEMPQPIMGIGHSFAASTLLEVAHLHPRLFTGIALLDPILASDPTNGNFAMLPLIALRRETWPSLEAASKFFSKHPMYKKMDSRVRDKFLEYGLQRIEGSEAVKLKTPVAQEAATFAKQCAPTEGDDLSTFEPTGTSFLDLDPRLVGRHPYYRPEVHLLFHKLRHLQPSCLFLAPTRSTMRASKPEERQARLDITGTGVGGSGGVAAGRVFEISVDATHYLPMEVPDVVAQHLADFVTSELAYFQQKQRMNRERRAHRDASDHANLDPNFVRWATILEAKSREQIKRQRQKMEQAKL